MLCAGREKAHFYTWSADKQVHETVGIDHEWLDQNLPRLRQFHAEFLDIIASPDMAADYLAPKRVVIDTPEAARMLRVESGLVNLGFDKKMARRVVGDVMHAHAGEDPAPSTAQLLREAIGRLT